MCLSTVYETRDGERTLLAKNIADLREVNGQIVMSDIMGIQTKVFGEIEHIDLMENNIIIKRYDFDTEIPESHFHSHVHSEEDKKKQLNRISRAIGHSQRVKAMIAEDQDCSAVLTQLSAVTSALRNLGKEIINEHMTHCIAHAIEDGDTTAVEEFKEAVKRFI